MTIIVPIVPSNVRLVIFHLKIALLVMKPEYYNSQLVFARKSTMK